MKNRTITKQLIIVLALSACVFAACGSAPAPKPPAPKPAAVDQKYYNGLIMDGAKPATVTKGDTLVRIAEREWGGSYDPYFFPAIMLASGDAIADPDLIEPETPLTVPDLKVNLEDPQARAAIKAYLLKVSGQYAQSGKSYRDDMINHLTGLAGQL